jgi:hypothetical protein
VTDSLNPVRLTEVRREFDGDNYGVRWQDSTFAGETRPYGAVQTPRALPAAKFATVTRRQLSARTSGDYIVLTPEVFLPAVVPLAAMRQGQGSTRSSLRSNRCTTNSTAAGARRSRSSGSCASR